MRLIDADELKIDFGFTWDDIAPTREEMFEIIDRQPTVEPKTGKWISHSIGHEHIPWGFDCSNCEKWVVIGKDIIKEYKFCPNCGAKMEGGEADG